jgi:hypothetical protein
MIIVIFSLISILILWIALRVKKSEKAVNLWANSTEQIVVKDIKIYNTACYKLLRNYALILFLIGMMISTEKMVFMIIGYLGVVFASLGLMVIYSLIESKHRM